MSGKQGTKDGRYNFALSVTAGVSDPEQHSLPDLPCLLFYCRLYEMRFWAGVDFVIFEILSCFLLPRVTYGVVACCVCSAFQCPVFTSTSLPLSLS